MLRKRLTDDQKKKSNIAVKASITPTSTYCEDDERRNPWSRRQQVIGL